MKYKSLFSPIEIAGLVIKNRITMAPMGCTRESQYGDGRVSTELIDYFEERAKGGAGMIISPFTAVDKRYYTLVLALFGTEHLLGISRLAEAIKVFDCKFILQLSHFGGKSPKGFEFDRNPIAPSSIKSRMYPFTPDEMTPEQIEETIKLFVQCGVWAKLAGCNGIELHAAHGYLINQFISPHANRRCDKYGGTLEKRMRFVDEISSSVREKNGKDFIIGIKFSAHEHLPGGIDLDEAKRIAGHINKQEIINYIHVSAFSTLLPGFLDCDYPSVPPAYSPYPLVGLAAEIKKNITLPVISTGGLYDPEYIDKLIYEGKADMVALGRSLIADPQWPNKAKYGGNIKHCILCNTCYFRGMNQMTIKCSVNPYVNEESRYSIYQEKKSQNLKKVVVAGAGPAGLEAAITASKRGHKVTLIEKQDRIGGLLNAAAVPVFKNGIRKLIDYYKAEITGNSNISIKLGVEADVKYIMEENADSVIFAIGSEPIVPGIEGVGNDFVFSAAEALENEELIKGENLLVIGEGFIGLEAALHFAMKGKKVITADFIKFDDILCDEHMVNKSMLIRNLWKNGVQIFSEIFIDKINSDRKIFAHNKNNKKIVFETENIIYATGYLPKKLNVNQMKEKLFSLNSSLEFFAVGDCISCEKIFNAVNSGAHAAWQL